MKTDTLEYFESIVVGAGIPGLYAARELHRAGHRVLLLESSLNPELPNYSTAGIPAETLDDFELPGQAVNAEIKHQIVGTSRAETRKTALGGATFAYVLDFGKTKRLMGEQCIHEGVSVHYGEKVTGVERPRSHALPQTIHTEKASYSASNLIDASGSNGVLAAARGLRPDDLGRPTLGMEYRIRTKRKELMRFQNTIATYFDAKELPHGYGWVFADGDDVFKVGLIEYWIDPARKLPALETRLKRFIAMLGIDLDDPAYEVLEKHGGRKLISRFFNRIRDGRMYAIGDSIGAINPFLAEGIRQGLVSAKYAVEAIVEDHPEAYEKNWSRFKGQRWKLAEVFASLCYQNPDARFIDEIVEISKRMSSEELRRLVFQYEFELIFRRAPVSSALALLSQLKRITRA